MLGREVERRASGEMKEVGVEVALVDPRRELVEPGCDCGRSKSCVMNAGGMDEISPLHGRLILHVGSQFKLCPVWPGDFVVMHVAAGHLVAVHVEPGMVAIVGKHDVEPSLLEPTIFFYAALELELGPVCPLHDAKRLPVVKAQRERNGCTRLTAADADQGSDGAVDVMVEPEFVAESLTGNARCRQQVGQPLSRLSTREEHRSGLKFHERMLTARVRK